MISLTPKPQLPKGMNDLLEFLQFLNNKKEVEKHLSELMSFTEQAEKAASLVGKASEIESLHSKAEETERKLSERLNGIHEESQSLIEAARTEAQKILSSAETRVESITANALLLKTEAETVNKEAKTKETELKKLDAQRQIAYRALISRENLLNKREAEIERKESILKQLG